MIAYSSPLQRVKTLFPIDSIPLDTTAPKMRSLGYHGVVSSEDIVSTEPFELESVGNIDRMPFSSIAYEALSPHVPEELSHIAVRVTGELISIDDSVRIVSPSRDQPMNL